MCLTQLLFLIVYYRQPFLKCRRCMTLFHDALGQRPPWEQNDTFHKKHSALLQASMESDVVGLQTKVSLVI